MSPISIKPALSFRASFLWTFAGNSGYALCQFLSLVAVAKLGTPENVGQLTLALALSSPFFMLASLQIRQLQGTDLNRDFQFHEYMVVRLITSTLALLLTCLLGRIERPDTWAVVCWIGLAKWLESISDVSYGMHQQSERQDLIARSMLVQGFVSLGAMAWALIQTRSMYWASLAYALARIVPILIFDLPRWFSFSVSDTLQIHSHRIWNLMRLGIPLGASTALISFSTYLPRYLLARVSGEYELGIFGAIASLMVIGTTFTRAMNSASATRLTRAALNRDYVSFRHHLALLLAVYLCLGFLGILFSLLAGPLILTLLFNADYAVYADILVWIMGASAVAYISGLLETSLISLREVQTQLRFHIVATIATAVIAALSISTFGLRGAALSMVLGKGCYVVLALGFLWKRLSGSTIEKEEVGRCAA